MSDTEDRTDVAGALPQEDAGANGAERMDGNDAGAAASDHESVSSSIHSGDEDVDGLIDQVRQQVLEEEEFEIEAPEMAQENVAGENAGGEEEGADDGDGNGDEPTPEVSEKKPKTALKVDIDGGAAATPSPPVSDSPSAAGKKMKKSPAAGGKKGKLDAGTDSPASSVRSPASKSPHTDSPKSKLLGASPKDSKGAASSPLTQKKSALSGWGKLKAKMSDKKTVRLALLKQAAERSGEAEKAEKARKEEPREAAELPSTKVLTGYKPINVKFNSYKKQVEQLVGSVTSMADEAEGWVQCTPEDPMEAQDIQTWRHPSHDVVCGKWTFHLPPERTKTLWDMLWDLDGYPKLDTTLQRCDLRQEYGQDDDCRTVHFVNVYPGLVPDQDEALLMGRQDDKTTKAVVFASDTAPGVEKFPVSTMLGVALPCERPTILGGIVSRVQRKNTGSAAASVAAPKTLATTILWSSSPSMASNDALFSALDTRMRSMANALRDALGAKWVPPPPRADIDESPSGGIFGSITRAILGHRGYYRRSAYEESQTITAKTAFLRDESALQASLQLIGTLPFQLRSLAEHEESAVHPLTVAYLRALLMSSGAKRVVLLGGIGSGLVPIALAHDASRATSIIAMDDKDAELTSGQLAKQTASAYASKLQSRAALQWGDLDEMANDYAEQDPGSADIVFIDAPHEKLQSLVAVARRIATADGLVLVNDVLCGGKIWDKKVKDPPVVSRRKLLSSLSSESSVRARVMEVGDGLLLIRKVATRISHAQDTTDNKNTGKKSKAK